MLKVLEVAFGEVGYLEKKSNAQLDDKTANAGDKNYTKYARDLDKLGFYNFPKNGYYWCDVFVDWCFVTAYGVEKAKKMINHGQYGAGCIMSARYYKQVGRLFKTPKIGDQIFFGKSEDTLEHTGLVYDVDDVYVYTVEGNTSGASGVISNGGGVRKKKYRRDSARICCFGRPDYGEEDDVMTGEEIYKALNEYMKSRPTPDWAQEELQEAMDAGITDGSNPMGLPTRLEVMLMTKRAAEK